jgi:hypothetical protein
VIVRGLALSLLGFTLCGGCTRVSGDSEFASGIVAGELRGANLLETSGLVASLRHPGHYWLHNDSGGEPEIVLVDSTGAARMTLRIDGVRNRDWEDIARLGDTILVADIGDNRAAYDTIFVIAVREPATMGDTTLRPIGVYPMQFPDGPRDAETLLADPLTGDWFIVTKREERVRVYRYPAPQRAGVVQFLERVPGELPMRNVVGGDISPDGREVLLKRYDAVLYWKRNVGESIGATLMRPSLRQPYTPEKQGEAIGFWLNGGGYVTTSEAEADLPQLFIRYPRRER